MVHGGVLDKWKCRRHPDAEIFYEYLEGKGVSAQCSEPDCTSNHFWENGTGIVDNKQPTCK